MSNVLDRVVRVVFPNGHMTANYNEKKKTTEKRNVNKKYL